MRGVRVIGNSWHDCGFRTVRRFFGGGRVFAIFAKLCEWVMSGHNIVIKRICVLNVTFIAKLNLPRIMRDLVSHPS